MSYTIQFSDSAEKNPITVEDKTINTETSLKIPGRQSTGYGAAIAENLLHLLENFAAPSSPSNPVEGQLWFNNSTEQLLVYDGTIWTPSGGLKKSITQPDPTESLDGDLWVDTDNQQLYLFSGSNWVLVGPEFSEGLTTGVLPSNIIGTDNVEYTVLEVQVSANIVAIVAFNTFSPKATIPGFEGRTIQPGINLANRDTNGDGIPDLKFFGTAEKAESLIVNNLSVLASNFLRGDVESTTVEKLNIQNNNGLSLGINNELNIGIEASAGIFQHNIEGSNIDFRTRTAGVNSTVVRIDSSQRVGINNEAPEEALDIIGNIQTTGIAKINDTTQSTNIGNGSIVAKGGVGIAKNLNVGESLTVTKGITLGNADLTVDQPESDLILPDLNNTRNIGRSNQRWRKIYATTFVGNLEGQVSGNISGKAGSADKLTTATTFRITGDVETVENAFDGQTGGGIKEFSLTVKNSLISGKGLVNDSLSNDEFLIDRRSGADTGLKRITRETLFENILGLCPLGTIVPFAGIQPPPGWEFCNGQLLNKGTYRALFDVIGDNFNPSPPTGEFGLPDLRGRFPLGNYNMGGTTPLAETNLTRVQGDDASTLGATSGSQDVSITTQNLPQHEHTLENPDGIQFYAYREVDNRGGDTPAGASGGKLQYGNEEVSQRIETSGGVEGFQTEDLGEPVSVVNPFQTINYIIYTGVIQ